MENCLKTQLKEVVNNDNLVELGSVLVRVKQNDNPTSSTQILTFSASLNNYAEHQFVAEIIGDGYFSATFGGESIGKTATLSKNLGEVYCSNGNYKIKITNKYNISFLTGVVSAGCNIDDFKYSNILDIIDPSYTLSWNHFPYWSTLERVNIRFSPLSFNLSEIANMTTLYYFDVGGSYHHGDIANLAGLTNLTFLELYAPQGGIGSVYGDIASLGTLTKLTYLSVFRGTSVSGTIESLVAAFRANGKTTGSIDGDYKNCPTVTFNGEPLPEISSSNNLSWTANTITCNGVTINA